MSLPDGFGNPEPAALEDNFAADRKINSMSRRHENRLDTGSRPQAKTNFLLGMILEMRERSSLRWRRAEGEKGCLGTTDGGDIQDDSSVRGQSHPAWMGDSVAIKDGHVGPTVDFPESLEEGRRFSKRQEPGDVRQANFHHRLGRLHYLKLGKLHNHDRGRDFLFFVIIAEIGSSNQRDFTTPPFQDKPAGQLFLESNGPSQVHCCAPDRILSSF
jgi:hypothetical protein